MILNTAKLFGVDLFRKLRKQEKPLSKITATQVTEKVHSRKSSRVFSRRISPTTSPMVVTRSDAKKISSSEAMTGYPVRSPSLAGSKRSSRSSRSTSYRTELSASPEGTIEVNLLSKTATIIAGHDSVERIVIE